ncbi:hypothetical protein HDU76_013712 [Blyttiomyces sp. JEL0837]|nr:hypothetical protein HDU76_013712 [Blyttiomyces sp. JEL0837]
MKGNENTWILCMQLMGGLLDREQNIDAVIGPRRYHKLAAKSIAMYRAAVARFVKEDWEQKQRYHSTATNLIARSQAIQSLVKQIAKHIKKLGRRINFVDDTNFPNFLYVRKQRRIKAGRKQMLYTLQDFNRFVNDNLTSVDTPQRPLYPKKRDVVVRVPPLNGVWDKNEVTTDIEADDEEVTQDHFSNELYHEVLRLQDEAYDASQNERDLRRHIADLEQQLIEARDEVKELTHRLADEQQGQQQQQQQPHPQKQQGSLFGSLISRAFNML